MMTYSLGIILLGVSMAAQQNLRPYDKTAENLFGHQDVDRDGEFSLQELLLWFAGYDANFNGVVSEAEFRSETSRLSPSLFPLTHALYVIYDKDKDGILTKYDFEELYKIWDEDENNVVSKHEFVHWWTITLTSLDHLHHPDVTFPATTQST